MGPEKTPRPLFATLEGADQTKERMLCPIVQVPFTSPLIRFLSS